VSCSSCTAKLVGRVEAICDLCSQCIVKAVAERVDLARMYDDLQAKNELLEREVLLAKNNMRRQSQLLMIESNGRDAVMRGLALDENPHDDEQERIMWAHGWSSADCREKLTQVDLVLRWAVEALDIVGQVAAGTGNTEITEKVGNVREKLAYLVED
jgi:hypothetical protein